MNMPPRWGFSSFEVGGYNDVAPPELKNGSRPPLVQGPQFNVSASQPLPKDPKEREKFSSAVACSPFSDSLPAWELWVPSPGREG